MIRHLTYPFTLDQIRPLKLGDHVLVSGRIFTGRDRVHKFLFEGGAAPVVLKHGALYHCGPVVVREKGRWKLCAAGPTTSIREEPYMADIIRRHRLTVIIGKGGMGKTTRAACRRYGCIYLNAVGGAAQVLADAVTRVTAVHFLKEFGAAEAMWELEVVNFPCVVTMDARGHSLHEKIMLESQSKFKHLTGEN